MSFVDSSIAAAVADRVATVTVASTVAAIRGATAAPPDKLQVLPYAVILPSSDRVEHYASARKVTCSFTVRLYLGSPQDFARRFPALHTYRTALRDIFVGDVTLGGLVDLATVDSTRIGADMYAGDEFVTVEATVTCVKGESLDYQA